MTTKKLVPRASGEGAMGVTDNAWGEAYYDTGNFNKGLFVSGHNITQVIAETVTQGGLGGEWERNVLDIYYNGGNVGIGTRNPGEKLDVRGSINLRSGFNLTWDSDGLIAANSTNMQFHVAGAELMRITSAGNIGIGTTSPSSRLDIGKAAGFANSIDKHMVLSRGTTNGAYLSTIRASATNDVSGLILGVGSQNILAIVANGNVGIGTTDPDGKLEVKGGFSYLEGLSLKPASGIVSEINSGSNSYDLSIKNGAGESLRIKADGNVGIGTSSPHTQLDIHGTVSFKSSGTYISATNAGGDVNSNDLTLTTANSTNSIVARAAQNIIFKVFESAPASVYREVMRITPWGSGANVGIGTTNPVAKLQIDGGNVSSSAYAFSAYGASNAAAKPAVLAGFDNGTTSYTMVLAKGSRSNGYLLGAFNSSNTLCFQMLNSGDMETALGNQIGTISDIRTKDSVVDATPKLSDVMKLRVVNFTRKSDPDKTKLIGFVAQEVEEVFPRFVACRDNREYDEDGNVISGFEDVKSVKFDSGFAILTKAIQEQQQLIEDLKSRIETLENK